MREKVMLFLLFCVFFSWRWMGMKNPLPESWTPSSEVRYTARILEEPEHTESQTIIRSGGWRISWWGDQDLKVGQRYALVGRVEPEVLMGKQVKISMLNPRVEEVGGTELSPYERAVIELGRVRELMVGLLSDWLPEPHASLAAGILLGVKRQMGSEFYRQLIATGTVHIIAASGYNVTVVAATVMGVLLSLFSRGVAIIGGVVAIAAYVVIAGASAAVVRAGIMGTLTLAAYYWGRPAEARRLLWITAGVMLLAQPLMLLDVGFQLSVAATAGLLYLEPWIKKRFQLLSEKKSMNSEDEVLKLKVREWAQQYLGEYWWPTIAASLATAPIIYLTFGRVSWISPLVNLLVLPLTPLIMFLAALTVGVGALIPGLGQVASWILYVPLWVMVAVIRGFG